MAMPASPTAPRSNGSLASSASASQKSHQTPVYPVHPATYDSIPVETLVEHLLAAKRSLSSISLVLRANDITQQAQQAHEETVILSAQTDFLKRGISDQVRILFRMRKGLLRSYDTAKKQFKFIVRTMDDTNADLTQTMDMLRATIVEPGFRPPGEQPRDLLFFVDEKSVDSMREALKQSIEELQAAQEAFDRDLLRFENDLRALTKILSHRRSSSPSDSASAAQPMPHLLVSLTDHSHTMAELLASLTHHFDLCVTAVRHTEGGAALARLRAAEVTRSQTSAQAESVSISGVIEAQDRVSGLDELEPGEREEMLQVVVGDAAEVPDVVSEITERLAEMEREYGSLVAQAEQARQANTDIIRAYRLLEDIGGRLNAYILAETEFVDRWENEKEVINAKLLEMDELKKFYEGYANAYDSLILEAERRRVHEEKIQAIWRKARESVERMMEADRRERELFSQDVGDYLPTDLWPGMSGAVKRWEVVPVREEPEGLVENSTPTLEKSVVHAARVRLKGKATKS